MPTNLPSDCLNAEKRYKEAVSLPEKIASLEEYISLIPKHKGTDRLRADLRKKLSKLKSGSQSSKGATRQESEYVIDKEGAAQISIIGAPNVGKSSFVDAVTHAKPEVADYPFTTRRPMPGMMPIKDIQVQLIDTPPLSSQYVKPEMMDLIKRSELSMLFVDIQGDPNEELESVISVLDGFKISVKEEATEESEKSRFYRQPTIIYANKFDDPGYDENLEIFKEFLSGEWEIIYGSALSGFNLDQVKQFLFNKLKLIRVYSKAAGKPADMSEPFVLRQGDNIEDFARLVHKDFVNQLKSARVWGEGVFDGQQVHRDHLLYDEDIVELNI